MRRRDWLYYVGVTAAGGAAGWYFLNIRSALTLPDLRQVLLTAERFQAPALVFVIPDDPTRSWQHGMALGAFLNGADDDTLARLALTEVVCVPRAELLELEGRLSRPLGRDPMLALIGPDSDEGGKLRVATLTLEDAKAAKPEGDGKDPILLQNARIARFLAGELSTLRIRELADRIQKICDWPSFSAMLVEGTDPACAFVTRATLHCQWAEAPISGVQVHGDPYRQLVELGRDRYVRIRPEGALWTQNGGCGALSYEGIEYQEEGMEGIACGMAFFSALEQRFLTFLTEDNVRHFH